jgi:ABC-type branched-subunit amino acid transport system permease subunit
VTEFAFIAMTYMAVGLVLVGISVSRPSGAREFRSHAIESLPFSVIALLATIVAALIWPLLLWRSARRRGARRAR